LHRRIENHHLHVHLPRRPWAGRRRGSGGLGGQEAHRGMDWRFGVGDRLSVPRRQGAGLAAVRVHSSAGSEQPTGLRARFVSLCCLGLWSPPLWFPACLIYRCRICQAIGNNNANPSHVEFGTLFDSEASWKRGRHCRCGLWGHHADAANH
jgi:hypothetical protein